MNQTGRRNAILVVEDEPQVCAYICDVLVTLGYELLGSSASAVEALALAEAEPPRIAVVDIQLAGPMDGIELAKILRERFDVLTIFLSGAADFETMKRVQAFGPLGFLRKPFRPSELINTMQIGLSCRG